MNKMKKSILHTFSFLVKSIDDRKKQITMFINALDHDTAYKSVREVYKSDYILNTLTPIC